MMNTGTTGSPFSNVTTYTSGSLSHTLTTADDGLVDGKIYTFKWYAVNDYGTGEDSDEIQVGVTDVFAASASMTKVSSLSTKTSISVTWGAVTAGTTPAGDILGYIYSMLRIVRMEHLGLLSMERNLVCTTHIWIYS
jgi:hypothetical protein